MRLKKYKIQKSCDKYQDGDCIALKKLYCAEEECSFYCKRSGRKKAVIQSEFAKRGFAEPLIR